MWERDFEIWLPFSQVWEKGLGDEGIFGLLQEVYWFGKKHDRAAIHIPIMLFSAVLARATASSLSILTAWHMENFAKFAQSTP